MIEFLAAYGALIDAVLLNAALGLSMYSVMSCGIFSVAGPGFMAVVAYSAALAGSRLGLPLPVGILIGLMISIVLALLLSWPLLRLRGHFFAVATIGWIQVVYVVLLNWSSLTNGILGINRIPAIVKTWHLVLFVVALGYMLHRVSNSRIGRAFCAIRHDENVAASLGINVFGYKVLAFLLSASIASVSGALFAYSTRFIDPTEFTFALALNFLAFAVLGGTAVWAGRIAGAVILTLLPEVFRDFGDYRDILNGAAVLLAIVYLPRGLIDPLLFRTMLSRAKNRL